MLIGRELDGEGDGAPFFDGWDGLLFTGDIYMYFCKEKETQYGTPLESPLNIYISNDIFLFPAPVIPLCFESSLTELETLQKPRPPHPTPLAFYMLFCLEFEPAPGRRLLRNQW